MARTLLHEKEKLSRKEIQQRSAAVVRSEQLIHTAERAFWTMMEGPADVSSRSA